MNKKITALILSAIVILVLVLVYLYRQNPLSPDSDIVTASTTISYLVSDEDTTKHCNGAEMDSEAYRQTINVEKTVVIPQTGLTKLQLIKEVLNQATTGTCHDVISKLDMTENNGVVYIPPIDAWAGASITMCSCKPQIEINLMRITGITQVVWMTGISSFEDCAQMGNPIMESYPRQCRYNDQLFVEEINDIPNKIVCTTDAKECPDGSYVSRTGPNCQFATCPQAK